MELRHLRYFVAIGEEENYRRAAQRLNVAQTALSTQIQDLEAELGFKLFDRLPRGVKLSAAGRLFLEDARRILQQVSEAAARAARVARGQSGTLRVGFTENASWRGIVPDSFRRFRERQPDAELQLTPATSLEQIEALRSGRLDAGFVFNMPKTDAELDHGRTERINHSEPGIAWHGGGMGQRHGAMAVSGRRGDHVSGRSGHAFAAGARMEKGQYLSFARQFYWRGTALGRRASGQKRLNAVGFCR